MFNKLKSIYNGWSNAFTYSNQSDAHKAMVQKRMEKCLTCPNLTVTYNNNLQGILMNLFESQLINEQTPVSHHRCGLCGCGLVGKLNDTNSRCPKTPNPEWIEEKLP